MLKNITKKIYIKDWLRLKPYERQTSTDLYYLRLSNEVKEALMFYEEELLQKIDLSNEEINELACLITSYFEDLVSGTNIWNSFVRMHHGMYGKPLPFYWSDDYFEEEINLEDVRFLMWYYLNTIQDEIVLPPQTEFIMGASAEVMDVFEEAWENAPENTQLLPYYQIDPEEKDFYQVRELIGTVLFNSYLFHPDTGFRLAEEVFDILEEHGNLDRLGAYLTQVQDTTLHAAHTQLLSKKGNEWTAEILGSDHPLSNDIRNMSPKIEGFFLYKGRDETHLFIEHIASGKQFRMLKESYDGYELLAEVDTMAYLGIVKWKGEWWFSGISTITAFEADTVLDEKNSVKSRMQVNFLDEGEKMDEILEGQFEAFKAFNNGSQIAFMQAEKLESFLTDCTNYTNGTLNLSDKEHEEALQRSKYDGLTDGMDTTHIKYDDSAQMCLVFFNPKGGIEMAFGMNHAFPLPNNPAFNLEDDETDVFPLLYSDEFSTELALFCINNCKDRLPFFTEGLGRDLLPDLDFLLRFWKRRFYHTKPEITLVGKENSGFE